MAASQSVAPNDWLEHPELLPPRPQTLTEAKYSRYFAVDIHGRKCHDQYVFLAPNGVAVIGIAPSHPLVASHRRANGYQPLDLKYIPPRLEHLQADELAAAAADDEAQEDVNPRPAVPVAESAPAQATEGAGDACGQAVTSSPALGEADVPQDGAAADATERLRSHEGASSAAETGGKSGAGGEPNQGSGRSRPVPPDIEPFGPMDCARINFDTGRGRNLAGTKMSGKKRNRCNQLRGNSVLAAVERRGGGPSFHLLCLLNGQLLEVNERLGKSPSLLYDRPCREGYLALLLPTPDALNYMRSRLLSEQHYLRLRSLTAEDLL